MRTAGDKLQPYIPGGWCPIAAASSVEFVADDQLIMIDSFQPIVSPELELTMNRYLSSAAFAVALASGLTTIVAAQDAPVEPATVLQAILGRNPDGSEAALESPLIPLLDTTLLTDPTRLFFLVAIDAQTGKILWRSPFALPSYGAVTYANGVVLMADTVTFSLNAYDSSTGVPLQLSRQCTTS